MRKFGLVICLISNSFVTSLAWSQTVYRCANSYSTSPCPDATRLNLEDQRSAEQKKQSEKVISQDSTLAKEMEKSRIQSERIQPSKSKPTPNVLTQEPLKEIVSKSKKTSKNKNNSKQPDYFIAKSADTAGKKQK
jgi:hypothetical protein